MLRQHLLWVFDRRQVLNPIPFLQLFYVTQQLFMLPV
jgi:hypothetical protein